MNIKTLTAALATAALLAACGTTKTTAPAAGAKPSTLTQAADGSKQWAFKGMPLYYYAKDTKSGDRLGDGVGGNWKIARP